MSQVATFADLFKKYRLKSEFETLTEFGDALVKKNLHYEDSIFSHWQKGSRIPHDRKLLLIILNIFVERGGIRRLKEANELLVSAGQGYLTEEELVNFNPILNKNAPFQVPRDLSYFTGREDYINRIKEDIYNGKHVLIHGPAGMGKTCLVIKLGHLLREDFPDGVLWYRLDTMSPEDIMVSLAHTFGEDITKIKNINNRASFIRSLLSNKNVLIIFDNLEGDFPLELVIPNGKKNAVVVTSQYEDLIGTNFMQKYALKSFNNNDIFIYTEKIIGKNYFKKNQQELLDVASNVGYLPLAVAVLTKQFMSGAISPKGALEMLSKEHYSLDNMLYDNKNLLSTLELVYKRLNRIQRDVFISMAIFDGEDFSKQAVAYINNSSIKDTQIHLNTLTSWSLLEHSKNYRYRLHPFIKRFTKDKLMKQNYRLVIKKALDYYIALLKRARYKKNFYFTIQTDSKNISSLFRRSYSIGYHRGIELIWRSFMNCLWDTGSWNEMNSLAKLTHQSIRAQGDVRSEILCCIEVFGWLYYWQGKINLAEKYTRRAVQLSQDIKDNYLLNYSKQRLGRVLQGKKNFRQSLRYFETSYKHFLSIGDYSKAANSLRYIGETYSLVKKYSKAKKTLHKALKLFDKADKYSLIEVFKNIIDTHLGALFLKEKKYIEAERYFNASLKLDKSYGSRTSGQIWNNIGLGLIKEDEHDKLQAELHFNSAREALQQFKLGSDIAKRHVFVSILKDRIKASSFNAQFSYLIKS